MTLNTHLLPTTLRFILTALTSRTSSTTMENTETDISASAMEIDLQDRSGNSPSYPTPLTAAKSVTPERLNLEIDAPGSTAAEAAPNLDETSTRPSSPSPRPIPNLAEEKLYNIPELQQMYEAYHSAYSDPTATPEAHLERGKKLALTLLEHYFPPKPSLQHRTLRIPRIIHLRLVRRAKSPR